MKKLFDRFFCWLGFFHPGELYRGESRRFGIGVIKKCACGKWWYDTAGPFKADCRWTPMTQEEIEHNSELLGMKP